MDINFVKYGPHMDGVLFPRDFEELIDETSPKPTIMGFTDQESLIWSLFFFKYLIKKQNT